MQIFSLVISLLSVHSSSQRTRKSSHQHFRKDSFLNLPKTARPGRNEERLRSARKQLRAPRPGVSLAAFSYADRRDRSIHPSIRRVRVRPRRARSRSDVSSGIRVAQLERRKGERERERWACHDVRVATEESGSEARTESAEADYDDDNSEGGPTTTPLFAFGVALKAAISEQLRFGTGVMKSERDGDVEHACLSPFAPAPSDLNP